MSTYRSQLGTQASDARWAALDGAGVSFGFRVTQSVLIEFVAGHDAADVMRELVQNEYDAKGNRLEIAFGTRSLTVSGKGNPIDARGWKRLSVMLGTGRIAGTQDEVHLKLNGIGSKNFGLRSLFLFGNRIYVASNGSQSVLDIEIGTPEHPRLDPESHGRSGVCLEVPYRTKRLDRLEPFTVEAERKALTTFVDELTPALIKLAQPGAAKSLREVVITSARCQRQIEWIQKVQKAPLARQGITALQRSIQVADSQTPQVRTMKELEFQRVLAVPRPHRDHPVPGYFQLPGGRIRIGVSLPIARKRVLVGETGRLYYPIGVGRGYTGCTLSICAPFDMDSDRSQILAPESSIWNKWLLDAAVDLTVELLKEDWFERYGADAYLALRRSTPPATPYFMQQLEARLKSDALWPSRARQRGRSRRAKLMRATELIIPDRPELEHFFAENSYLDSRLANDPRTVIMARDHGAKRFTNSSLVRLRCTGLGAYQAVTPTATDEANYRYTDPTKIIATVDWQTRCARALDSDSARLSKANKTDIANSPSTQTAAGTLRRLSELWLVEPSLVDKCPVPSDLQLHPELVACRVYRQLIGKDKRYDPANWLEEVTRKVQQGTLGESERFAAYRYLISPQRQVKQKILAKLRDTPLLRDHRGVWVSPRDIILPTVPGVTQLEPVLHLPHPDYSSDQGLARALRFRDRLDGQDLVRFARYVVEHPDCAVTFEHLLSGRLKLLKQSAVDELKAIPFLRSSQRSLATPQDLYISNPVTRACLGPDAPFAVGRHARLYRHLGCMERPRAEAIVERLRACRDRVQRPENLETLYPTLVTSLKAERLPLHSYEDEPILWTDAGFGKPSEVLLTSDFQHIFLNSIPQLGRIPERIHQAYSALGARSSPQPQHWQKLFAWIDERYRSTHRPLRDAERKALRAAYRKLAFAPFAPSEPLCFLLDTQGRVHSLEDVRAGRYVRNDDPSLAQACDRQHAGIALADTAGPAPEQISRYFHIVGIRNLTDTCEKTGVRIGAEVEPSRPFNLSSILNKIQSRSFRSALRAAIVQELHTVIDSVPARLRQLRQVRGIVFAESVEELYSVRSRTVFVHRDVALDGDRIVVKGARSRWELLDLIAQAIAGTCVNSPSIKRTFADRVAMLLHCSSAREMANYLHQRGIEWSPPADDRETLDDEDADDNEAGEQDNTQLIGELLANSVAKQLTVRQQAGLGPAPVPSGAQSSARQEPPAPPAPVPPEAPLPPLETVGLRTQEPSGSISAHPSTGSPIGRSGGSGTPRRPVSEHRRKELGDRGEQLVFDYEVSQLLARGQSPQEVRWISQQDEYADHDIRSLDEDGQEIFIEVKSTTDRHGSFEWSKGEFTKALVARDRYILVRVYEVDGEHPTQKRFRDPISLLKPGKMSIGVTQLHANVENL